MNINGKNVYDVIEQIIKDPSASYWLKDAIRSTMARDVVDAANDAEVLSAILNAKAENALKGVR